MHKKGPILLAASYAAGRVVGLGSTSAVPTKWVGTNKHKKYIFVGLPRPQSPREAVTRLCGPHEVGWHH
jgi:hypothetical protein